MTSLPAVTTAPIPTTRKYYHTKDVTLALFNAATVLNFLTYYFWPTTSNNNYLSPIRSIVSFIVIVLREKARSAAQKSLFKSSTHTSSPWSQTQKLAQQILFTPLGIEQTTLPLMIFDLCPQWLYNASHAALSLATVKQSANHILPCLNDRSLSFSEKAKTVTLHTFNAITQIGISILACKSIKELPEMLHQEETNRQEGQDYNSRRFKNRRETPDSCTPLSDKWQNIKNPIKRLSSPLIDLRCTNHARQIFQHKQSDHSTDCKKIKRRYHKLVQQVHPDKNRDNPEATLAAYNLNNAYDILREENDCP